VLLRFRLSQLLLVLVFAAGLLVFGSETGRRQMSRSPPGTDQVSRVYRRPQASTSMSTGAP
jgi:hypothetical protein